MNEYMKILGLKVVDLVTGFSGIVTSIGFDLYGCVQCVVTPESKDGKTGESGWFDHKRLKAVDPIPVMELPSFLAGDVAVTHRHEPGPERKPSMGRFPR